MNGKPAPPMRPSALVRASALILGGFGLLFTLIALDEGPDSLLLGAFLLGLGAALWWGRRVSYLIGLVGTALLVGLIGLVAADQRDVADVVALGLAATPLLLLLPPAARRPVQVHHARRERLPQPEGWTRELAGGRVKFAFMAAMGVLVIVAGTGIAVGGSWGIGATAAGFGAAILSSLPAFFSWPRRRTAVRLTRVTMDGRSAAGVVFPYSPARMLGLMIASAFAGLTSIGFVVNAGELGDNNNEAWVIRVVGSACILLFLGGAIAMGVRGQWRRWRVVLTPQEVLFEGTTRSGILWNAVEEVEAYETTTYMRGALIHEPFVRVIARDPATIAGGRYHQAMRYLLPPSLAESITIPIRPLAVEPKALLYALRYYHSHPEARSELGSTAALRRIRQCDLIPPDLHGSPDE